MAGGIGSRFWPVSRKEYPKQFQDILGVGTSMLQQTIDRFTAICPLDHIYIVTNRNYIPLVKEQIPDFQEENILGEPFGRNTAAAVAYACYKIQSINAEANVVVSPSDHVVLKEAEFERTIKSALDFTQNKDCLLTLGITPSRADTGYGYIQFAEREENPSKVKTFTEKPPSEIAEKFLESGDFLWNAGIFIWNVNSIVKQFETFLPDMDELFFNGNSIWNTPEEDAYIDKVYGQITNISIDHGVMEKADNVFVMKSEFGWSDVGTWNSLYSIKDKDDSENVLFGDVKTYDSNRCLIRATEGKKVIVQGLQDFIVVEHDDVIMICERKNEQMVKQFVHELDL